MPEGLRRWSLLLGPSEGAILADLLALHKSGCWRRHLASKDGGQIKRREHDGCRRAASVNDQHALWGPLGAGAVSAPLMDGPGAAITPASQLPPLDAHLHPPPPPIQWSREGSSPRHNLIHTCLYRRPVLAHAEVHYRPAKAYRSWWWRLIVHNDSTVVTHPPPSTSMAPWTLR